MRYTATVALAGATSVLATNPFMRRAIQQFPAGTSWDIVLNNENVSLDQLKAAPGNVIDVDLEDNEDSIRELGQEKIVICYFSAGSREDWRNDDDSWNSDDYGQAMDWPGEWWANVRSEHLRDIMRARIERAAAAGCHAVDPDNVDGYNENQDGFGYPASDYADYVNWIASVAHENDMAMGLKNALDIIPDVIDNIEFAVNEQCHEYKEWDECDRYRPLTTRNLAVFNIEYGLDDCSDPEGVNLSTLIKPANQNLDTIGGQCPN